MNDLQKLAAAIEEDHTRTGVCEACNVKAVAGLSSMTAEQATAIALLKDALRCIQRFITGSQLADPKLGPQKEISLEAKIRNFLDTNHHDKTVKENFTLDAWGEIFAFGLKQKARAEAAEALAKKHFDESVASRDAYDGQVKQNQALTRQLRATRANAKNAKNDLIQSNRIGIQLREENLVLKAERDQIKQGVEANHELMIARRIMGNPSLDWGDFDTDDLLDKLAKRQRAAHAAKRNKNYQRELILERDAFKAERDKKEALLQKAARKILAFGRQIADLMRERDALKAENAELQKRIAFWDSPQTGGKRP